MDESDSENSHREEDTHSPDKKRPRGPKKKGKTKNLTRRKSSSAKNENAKNIRNDCASKNPVLQSAKTKALEAAQEEKEDQPRPQEALKRKVKTTDEGKHKDMEEDEVEPEVTADFLESCHRGEMDYDLLVREKDKLGRNKCSHEALRARRMAIYYFYTQVYDSAPSRQDCGMEKMAHQHALFKNWIYHPRQISAQLETVCGQCRSAKKDRKHVMALPSLGRNGDII